MPSFVTPKKNTQYIFYISLVSQADANLFQVNPTLAVGDVKVSTDGGAEANIATLPVVTPATTKRVKVILSAAEMNGDNVSVTFSDVAGAEWADLTINIQTTTSQIDDIPVPIKKNTALAGFPFFMVDSANRPAGKTLLTVICQRSIDGGAFANCANAASEVSNGWYKIDLAASDLNGDTIALKFTATGADGRQITIITDS